MLILRKCIARSNGARICAALLIWRYGRRLDLGRLWLLARRGALILVWRVLCAGADGRKKNNAGNCGGEYKRKTSG